MSMPLEGLRVVDLSRALQGPSATMMLGDLGAEVIKVEPRISGDPARGWIIVYGVSMLYGDGRNLVFDCLNRNKKSITLDLKKEEGRQVIYDLVKKSDIFVQNLRQGVVERRGLGYEVLKQHNPKLIYASASPYGPLGPDAAKPAMDPDVAARSGFMANVNTLGEPYTLVPGVCDQMGGVMLAYAIMAAVVARERLGVGQKVDSSLIASVAWLQTVMVHTYLIAGHSYTRQSRFDVQSALSNSYQCADGKWFLLTLFQQDKLWPDFCKALGIEALEKDPRFDTAQTRNANTRELTTMCEKIFATKTLAEWFEIFKNYPDLQYEAIQSIGDLATDPQMLANNYIVDVPDPSLGSVKLLNIPFGLSETPGSIRSVSPELGQHTEEVLTEICGFSWDKIAELKEKEVI